MSRKLEGHVASSPEPVRDRAGASALLLALEWAAVSVFDVKDP
jgi:hypothetical protein